MGRLFLVRHAQAAFLQQDYDKLSALGETQARLLGEYWARHNMVYDRVGSGPGVRHKDTAKIAGEALRNAGLGFPEPVVMSELDEYPGNAVLDQSLPRLIENDSAIRELHRAFQASHDSSERRNSFQKLFEAVIGKWVIGELVLRGVETWPDFCRRVNQGLSRFLANGRPGESVVVFSSGGPIAVAVQRALALSPQSTLQVSWMARNCSFSEFLYSKDRFTLSTFNSFPHLDHDSLLTYR